MGWKDQAIPCAIRWPLRGWALWILGWAHTKFSWEWVAAGMSLQGEAPGLRGEVMGKKKGKKWIKKVLGAEGDADLK